MKAKDNIKDLLVLVLMLILLFITQFFTSCISEKEEYIQPELNLYWQSFQTEVIKRGVRLQDKTVVMTVGDLPEGRRGYYKGNKKTATITINKDFFEKYSESGHSYIIEATVFHELGHGLLGRGHTSTCLDSVRTIQTLNGPENIEICIPSSIMMRRETDNGYVIMSNAHGYYEEHRDYYIDELFGLN